MSSLLQKIIEAAKLSHRYVRHDEEGNVIQETDAEGNTVETKADVRIEPTNADDSWEDEK